VAARFSGPGQPYEGLALMTSAGPRWTNEVRLVEEHLCDPLRWQKPRLVFVNSMSDLFHEKLAFEEIDRIMAVMALAPQHTFQVLTKRAGRMRAYLEACNSDRARGESLVDAMEAVRPLQTATLGRSGFRPPLLSHVWWGISAEDQPTLEERLGDLLSLPEAARVRWISAEPLLGRMNLRKAFQKWHRSLLRMPWHTGKIDWVVAGGESGPGARVPHPQWFIDMRDECRVAGIPFFLKQWGEYLPAEDALVRGLHGPHEYIHSHEGCQGIPQLMVRVGKKAAGDLLEGKQYHEYPG
jgi:protein gp37